MNVLSPTEFLQNLPLVLAGPILQRTEPTAITVWLALQHPCQVRLTIFETTDAGMTIAAPIGSGDRHTVAIGQHLHIVAVTARICDPGLEMTGDRLYAYDLDFIDDTTQVPYSLEQALCSPQILEVNLSYFPHEKPTFALPPTQLSHLRIVHGSCRKPHGDGFDALTILDCLLESTAHQPQHRPHQLFLTGDQIYADDVANPLLCVASRLGDLLLGWSENLPLDHYSSCTPTQFPPGSRAEVATKKAGFTAGLHNKRSKVISHLFSLGEYYVSYLLSWSPVCWRSLPPASESADQSAWNHELRDMEHFTHTLWKVRRALANTPTYSIFDDHDVSDDWNLNRAWCLRVYAKRLGRRVVQNALLAYAVFQAWGNTPQQFEPGQLGDKLLQAAQAWSDSGGSDWDAYEAIAQAVGMPANEPQTGTPKFIPCGNQWVLSKSPNALTWHYTIHSRCHQVIVLDTRTERGYPMAAKAIAPPALLCDQAFDRQLRQPLQRHHDRVTFVIAPTNLFGLWAIDWVHEWFLKRDRVFAADVGDAWNLDREALAKLLNVIFEHRKTTIVLSGDIHYSAAAQLVYRKGGGQNSKFKIQNSKFEVQDARFKMQGSNAADGMLVQLTASALKNEELATRLIHTRLKQWLIAEKPRQWIGWQTPPMLQEMPSALNAPFAPDWQTTLTWLPRCPCQVAEVFGTPLPWLLSRAELRLQRSQKRRWFEKWRLWRSRWFQEGNEVVGMNNLAVVQFTESDGDSQNNELEERSVVQDVYWFANWQGNQIVYSRYVSMRLE
jgi:hypothetical protein